MNISLIGSGEVGSCYADALAAAGHRIVVLCDERPTDKIDALAHKLGARVETGVGPWLAEADVIIGAVYGYVALDVAKLALPLMKPGAVYADFSTASPAHMAEAAGIAATLGRGFVDVAIMGAISLSGGATPLLCAGAGAEAIVTLMASGGAPARVGGSQAGDAAELKLLRSIFTKGMEALSVECLVAAEKKGLRAELYEVLGDVDRDSLSGFMERCVVTHVIHAKRRLVEVQEAKRQLRRDHLAPLVLDGVEALFQRTADALTAHPPVPAPDGVAASLAWLAKQAAMPH
jgi:3-hydroxyisobutyrate dehydrogenase